MDRLRKEINAKCDPPLTRACIERVFSSESLNTDLEYFRSYE